MVNYGITSIAAKPEATEKGGYHCDMGMGGACRSCLVASPEASLLGSVRLNFVLKLFFNK